MIRQIIDIDNEICTIERRVGCLLLRPVYIQQTQLIFAILLSSFSLRTNASVPPQRTADTLDDNPWKRLSALLLLVSLVHSSYLIYRYMDIILLLFIYGYIIPYKFLFMHRRYSSYLNNVNIYIDNVDTRYYAESQDCRRNAQPR